MKTILKPALLGLVIASALGALPLAARAQSTTAESAAPMPATPDLRVTKNVSGKVMAKSDTSLTVGSRTVSLSSATTFSKSGTSIGSGDVKVGDIVNIVTTDDGQVAVSVNVTTSS